MQSCYSHIIDARHLATHLFRYKCGLLRNWDIGCPSTDYANMSSSATMYIVKFVDYYCASGSMNTYVIRVKHLTQHLNSIRWNSTDNRSSRFIQYLASHCNNLLNIFCLAINDFRNTLAMLTLNIRTNFNYR